MEAEQHIKDMLIVVPYRNREEHLAGFLDNSPRYFNEQKLTYDILICELEQGGDWNAGLCCNSICFYLEASKMNYKYVYIHHVDIWPTEGEWLFPPSNEVFFNLGDYGSCMMELKTFLDVGGYSNDFWGWGGEDNDLYYRLQAKNYKCNQIGADFQVKYNTDFQNHSRGGFNGANYGNGLKTIYVLREDQKNNINQFFDFAEVKDLQHVNDNIYKQIVCPLVKSPRESIKDKVIIGYIQNYTDFNNLASFVKSSMIYAGHSYDVVLVVGDTEPPEALVSNLEAHGIKIFHDTTPKQNLFIDRFACYKRFLQANTHYKTALHVDVNDLYFQSDPFDSFDNSKLTFSSESFKLQEEDWNKYAFAGIYGYELFDAIKHNNIICGGVIGGPVSLFLQFVDKILAEQLQSPSDSIGADQPYIQKILYYDQFLTDEIDIKTIHDSFCINLHVCIHNPDTFNDLYNVEHNRKVRNSNNTLYSIVHQYNRSPSIYQTVTNHYIQYFYPL